MDPAFLKLPPSSYWVVTIWAFVVFIAWYFYRHSEGSRATFIKIIAFISTVFIAVLFVLWYQNLPAIVPIRVAIFPFPKHSDSGERLSWESLAVSEITTDFINSFDSKKIAAYDLESLMAAVDYDSLSDPRYVMNLAGKIKLDYLLFGTLRQSDSQYVYNFCLVEVKRNLERISEMPGRSASTVIEIARSLYSEFAANVFASSNGVDRTSVWSQQEQTAGYFNAKLYNFSKQIEPAVEFASATVRKDSSSVKCLNLLAALLIKRGEQKIEAGSSALDDFRTAKSLLLKSRSLDQGLSTTRRLFAELYLANKKWMKAEVSLSEARDRRPLDPRVYVDLTRLHRSRYQKWGFGTEADLLEHAIYLNPAFIDAYLRLADYHKRDRRQDLAIERLQQALTINPNHVEALMMLGSTYVTEKRTLEALQLYERVLNLEPDNSDVYYNLGIVYYYDKDYENAIKSFEHALTLDDHLDSHLYLAYIYELKGETDRAVSYLRARIKKRKNDDDRFAEEARKHLFNIMSAQGKIDSLMSN